ncbi:MAG: phosphoribosyl-ATP diphosphatase [Woeseiaceae bacterium]|nr:phosphoribosyl-ATP diphosphatase [Woeseiaceae bacterium]
MSQNSIDFLNTLEATILDRIESPSETSYTSRLLDQGAERVAQKVGEEGVELAIASLAGSDDEVTNEAADLIYHLLVLINSRGIRLADVCSTLEGRHR